MVDSGGSYSFILKLVIMKKIFLLPLLLLPVFIISFKPVKEIAKIERPSDGNRTPKGFIVLNSNFPSPQHLTATPKFNAVLFEEAVNKKMKNLVKGYAFAIGDKDGIKARSEGGWAQDPADGNLKMTTKCFRPRLFLIYWKQCRR
jgi:hypothetical protein